MQVIGSYPDIDRDRLPAQLAKIEVTLGGGGIQNRVQPQIQATREGLADRARRHWCQIDHVIERAHALGRERPGATVAALNQALPVLAETLIVTRHPLAKHFTNGVRKRWRLEEIECDA